jgi:uncharacterized protein YfaS (alpha-2-macroglobulin family)
MGPARPILDLPGRMGVLERSGDPTYPVQARNVSRVQVRGCFVDPEALIPFIMQRKMFHYLSESADDFLADAAPGPVRSIETKVETPPNTTTYQPVRLKGLFGSDPAPGACYFDLNATETNDPKTGRPIYRRALVQVSDIGLSVKFSRTNTLIWTTELSNGKPMAEVSLELRNRANQVLWRGVSDKEGLAIAPGAAQLKIAREENDEGGPSLFVFARHDNQFSFVSTDWDDGIAPWNFGLPSRDLDQPEPAMTWVLTSLPLYKPGDEVQFKIIRRIDSAED